MECFLTKHNAVHSRRPSASLVGPTAVGKRLSLAADCGREDIEAAGVAPTVAATAAGILPQGLNPTAKYFGYENDSNLPLSQGLSLATSFFISNQVIISLQHRGQTVPLSPQDVADRLAMFAAAAAASEVSGGGGAAAAASEILHDDRQLIEMEPLDEEEEEEEEEEHVRMDD